MSAPPRARTRTSPRAGVLSELGIGALASAGAAGLALVLASLAPAASWTLLLGAAVVGLAATILGRAAPGASSPTGTRAGLVGTLARGVLLPPLMALTGDHPTTWRVALAVLGIALALMPGVAALGVRAAPFARGVPGLDADAPRLTPHRVAAVHAAAVLGTAAAGLSAGTTSTVVALLAAVAALAASAASLAASALRVRRRRAFDVRAFVETVDPHCLVHWDAPDGTGYQLGMWLPHLERAGLRHVVVVRRPELLTDVPQTAAPVLVLPSIADLDEAVAPGVRAAIYVNGATANAHLVRHARLVHVQLNHGDSDKPPSYNPAFRMYDKNFVAGQAAVDRFAAHGITTAPGFFEIVGRPQVAGIEPRDASSEAPERPVVLYAPTWAGDRSDVTLTSLPRASDVVAALLARGCTVIFRPHPHALASSLAGEIAAADALLAADPHARQHQRSAQAVTSPLAALVNTSDALVADISSVVTDYLFSRKPVLVLAMGEHDTAAFRAANPVAQAAYVVHHGAITTGIGRALDEALSADPLASAREHARRYVLGDIPDEGYVDHFRDVLRAVVLGTPRPS